MTGEKSRIDRSRRDAFVRESTNRNGANANWRLPHFLFSSWKELPYAISTPMLRAVPLTLFIAASTVKQFRSGILSLAISSTCFCVILPTLFLFGSADPFARFTARLISTGTGGVLVMKVNERSLKI